MFIVTLDEPLGGGLGRSAGLVAILGDGYPHGVFRIRAGTTVVNEYRTGPSRFTCREMTVALAPCP